MGLKFTDFLPGIGSAIDAYAQHSANKANKKIAREQMAFQERMSSTEMQRRVNDLRAAGLNPMLAGMNQQGASSAQGATTRVEPITRNTASTALAVTMQRQQLENMEAQTRLLREQTHKTAAETEIVQGSALQQLRTIDQIETQTQSLAKDVELKVKQLHLTDEQIRSARLSNAQLEQMQPLLQEFQRLRNAAERLGMSQRQVDAKFAESLGGESKVIQMILNILRGTR